MMAAFSVLGAPTQETPDALKCLAVVLVSESLWPFILSGSCLRSHRGFLVGDLGLVGSAITWSLHTHPAAGHYTGEAPEGEWGRSRVASISGVVAALCFWSGSVLAAGSASAGLVRVIAGHEPSYCLGASTSVPCRTSPFHQTHSVGNPSKRGSRV